MSRIERDALAVLEDEHQRIVEKIQTMLWEAQLREYPDSVRVSYSDASEWARETFDTNPRYADIMYDNPTARVFAKWDFIAEHITRHKQQNASGLLSAMQYPYAVFYECCGGKFRGARYGVEGSQYFSGFVNQKGEM
jgi:hypothetical protein